MLVSTNPALAGFVEDVIAYQRLKEHIPQGVRFAMSAMPANGDFSTGLSQWIATGAVSTVSGEAVLEDRTAPTTRLYQPVSLAPGDYILTFDVRGELAPNPGPGIFPDTFFASLYFTTNPATFDIATPPFDDVIELLDLDAGGFTVHSGSIGPSPLGVPWTRFTLPFTSAFEYVVPAFELADIDGTPGNSVVRIDNVSIVVPEPGTVALALLGLALVAIRRLRRPLAVALLAVATSAEAQTPFSLAEHFVFRTANERSTLDRRTGEIVSTVDVTLMNLGGREVRSPLHAVVNLSTGGVQVVGVLGGPTASPYNRFYIDLSPLMPQGRLAANASLTFPVVFRRDRNVTFSYEIEPYGLLKEERAPSVVAPPGPFVVDEGGSLQIPVTATDPDGDVLVLSAAPAISNASFVANSGAAPSGMLTFGPGFDQAGFYTVQFAATDPLGLSSSTSILVEVRNENRGPELGAMEPRSVREGELLQVALPASDPDDDPLDIVGVPLPPNAVIIPETKLFVFAPDFTQSGAYTVLVEVSDGSLTGATQELRIDVEDVAVAAPVDTNLLTLVVDPLQSPTLATRQRVTGAVNGGTNGAPRPQATAGLITGLSPAVVLQGQTADVVISGQGAGVFATDFGPGSVPLFGPGITVNAVTVSNAALLVANVTVATDAETGARPVSVLTGDETAFSIVALTIGAGSTSLTGTLVNAETTNAIAGAIVAIAGTSYRTTTGLDGSFVFHGLPPGVYELIVNAPNHELIRFPFEVRRGVATQVGPIVTRSLVFDAGAPASVSLASVLARGAVDPAGGLSRQEAEKVIVDAILLTGGSEAGVLDSLGNQLNPGVTGEGLVSLNSLGVRLLAQKLERGGETISLGEFLFAISFGMEWSSGQPPPLDVLLDILQEIVNDAWAQPTLPENYLPILLFNRGRRMSVLPPVLTPELRLSPLQSYLLFTSLFASLAPEAGTTGVRESPTHQLATMDRLRFFLGDAWDALVPPALAQGIVDRRYTSWATRFSQNTGARVGTTLTTAASVAYRNYLMVLGAMALPTPSLIGLSVGAASASAIQGPLNALVAQIFRGISLAAQVPEPPTVLSAEAEVAPDGTPRVRVRFRRSPSHFKEGDFLYTLFRFRGPEFPREEIATMYFSAALNGDLRPQDFDRVSLHNTLTDEDPLPQETGIDGTPTRAAAATWFYTLTTTRVNDPDLALVGALPPGIQPWLGQLGPLSATRAAGLDLVAFVYSSHHALVSDYSIPVVVRVSNSGATPNAAELEVDPKSGDVFYSDTVGTPPTGRSLVQIASQGVGERRVLAGTGFANPGQRGLAIDNRGTLYTDNAASDARFGGRLFSFTQPSGARSFVGSINYFSQLLQFAHPVAGGPMDMGPGATPGYSPEDLYVVDELPNQVKRAPVQSTANPFRNVGQPWVTLPYRAASVDLEVEDDGDGALLVDRIAGPSLSAALTVFPSFAVPGQTVAVAMAVGNPGSAPVSQVTAGPLATEGDATAFLVSPPDSPFTLAAGETRVITSLFVAGESGVLRFVGVATGDAGGGETISSPRVRSLLLEIGGPLVLDDVLVSASHVPPGGALDVTVRLRNRGSMSLQDVVSTIQPVSPLSADEPTGTVQLINVPSPSNVVLAAGASHDFVYRFEGESLGRLVLRARGAGAESVGGAPVSSARRDSPIVEITPADVVILGTNRVDLNATFSMTVRVHNIGSATLGSVLPALSKREGAGGVELFPTSHAPQTIPPGSHFDFVYPMQATNGGQVVLGAEASMTVGGGAAFRSTAPNKELAIGNAIQGRVLDVVLFLSTSQQQAIGGGIDDANQGLPNIAVSVVDVEGVTNSTCVSSATGEFVLSVPGPGRYTVRALHPPSNIGYERDIFVGDRPETENIHLPVSLVETARDLNESLQLMSLSYADPEFLEDFVRPGYVEFDFFGFNYGNAYAPIQEFIQSFRRGFETPIYKGIYRGTGRPPNEWDALMRLNLSMSYMLRRAEEIKLPSFLVVRGLTLVLLTTDFFTKKIMKPMDMWFSNTRIIKWSNALYLKNLKPLTVKFYRVVAILMEFAAEQFFKTQDAYGIQLLSKKDKDAFLHRNFVVPMFKLTRFLMAFKAGAFAGDAAFEFIYQAANGGGTQLLVQDIYLNTLTEPILMEALGRARRLDVAGDTGEIFRRVALDDLDVSLQMKTDTDNLLGLHKLIAVVRGVNGLFELGSPAAGGPLFGKFTPARVGAGVGLVKRVTGLVMAPANVLMLARVMLDHPSRTCLAIEAIYTGDERYLDAGVVAQVECSLGLPVMSVELAP